MRLTNRPSLTFALASALILALGIEPQALAKEMDTEMPLGAVGGSVHADPFTGLASTSVPIDIPAGRNGIQPNLNLVYSSSNGNGWVGMGWKLELGSIQRNTRFGLDYSQNEYSVQMSGVSSDLIQAPPPAGSDEYQAKFEGAFYRIKKPSSGGWEVTDTKGTKYLFGQTTASRAANPADESKVFKWYLDRIEDRDGNYLTVSYVTNQGQVYLDHIDYTGNGTTLPPNSVKFYLASRSDAPPLYSSNYSITTAKRLNTVEVKANNILVRAYRLNYAISQATNNSLLAQIQQFGRDAQVSQVDGTIIGGTALPSIVFGYGGGSPSLSISFSGPAWNDAGGWGSSAAYYGTIQYPDLNGDGKADICGRAESGITCYLSTGSGFSTAVTGPAWNNAGGWTNDRYYATIQYPDLNGDGKADICGRAESGVTCYLSTGSGFSTAVAGPAWSDAGGWGAGPRYYGTIRFRDISGDGKMDLCGRSSNGIECWKPEQDSVESLRTIANGLGGSTAIAYTPSTQYANTQLSYSVQTVSAITTCDNWNSTTSACAGTALTTAYTYSGGYHHIGDREFRGFNYFKATGPVGPSGEQLITEMWSHQGNDVVVGTNNPNVPNGYTKGLPYQVKVTDATGRVWSDTTTTYVADSDGVAPFFTPVAQVDASIDNGTKQTRTVYASYDVYGNVLREDQSGDLSTTADDRTVVRTFANNTTDWLIGFPTSETVYQGIGLSPQVTQTTLYYDGTTSCSTASTNQSPAKGHLTRTVRWLNGGTNPETRMAYDAMGNLLCTRDANGNTTTLTYDSTNTFAMTAVNPLGHVVTTQYYGVDGVAMDKGLYGQVKSVTDPNGQVVATEYDALGRKTKVTLPDGLITTITSNYGTGFTVGTQHVLTSTSGAGLVTTLTTATYFDGLGRTVRKEGTGPDSKTVVTEVQYDSRGAVRKKSLPYFKTIESVTGRWATTSYDALGRVTRIDNPDGARSLSCFSDWVTVTIDEADHRKRETKDAYGRTIRVDEYQTTASTCDPAVGTPYVSTTYQYDVQGDLPPFFTPRPTKLTPVQSGAGCDGG